MTGILNVKKVLEKLCNVDFIDVMQSLPKESLRTHSKVLKLCLCSCSDFSVFSLLRYCAQKEEKEPNSSCELLQAAPLRGRTTSLKV